MTFTAGSTGNGGIVKRRLMACRIILCVAGLAARADVHAAVDTGG